MRTIGLVKPKSPATLEIDSKKVAEEVTENLNAANKKPKSAPKAEKEDDNA